ncbi:hypothetical protein BH09BAC1_BH09BAC1_13270 [soil metagenome]
MHPAKKILGRIGRCFSIPQLLSISGKQLLLPFYHVVSNERLPHIINLYQYRNVAGFEADLDALLQYYQPIGLQELLTGGEEPKQATKPYFHLTFDDGLRECAEVVAPILLRKGIPATFFLNSGFIDNRGLFYRYKVSLIIEHIKKNEISHTELEAIGALMPEGARKLDKSKHVISLLLALSYEHQFDINQIADVFEIDFGNFLRQQKPYMTKVQIQQLITEGFTVGAHSIDHPPYRKLELIEQLEQTTESLRHINELFQVPYKVFAFPFTDYGVGKSFFEEMYHNGQRFVDLSFGTAGFKIEKYPRHLQRIAMEDGQEGALQTIKEAYMGSIVQQALGLNRIKRD